MTMSSGTNSIDGVGYGAKIARDNGAPEWLAIMILLVLSGLLCFCEMARHSVPNTNTILKSALDQEAVSFMTDERQ